jgi:uncharacterized protein (TIGR00251 family)
LIDEIFARVSPRASSDRLEFVDPQHVKVYVTVPPESGKANARVIELIAKEINVPKSRLVIVRGSKGRDKVIKILR